MEAYLNKTIKEVIDLFPAVGDILSEYDVDCATCNVGTCLLKDIIEIHNLSSQDEQEVMAKIAKAIDPDQEVQIPDTERDKVTGIKELSYSGPMKTLVDEHVLIKRLIAMIPAVIDNLDVESKEGKQLIINSVDFIRSYADSYHHAKEEKILFAYFDEKSAILQAMYEDHRNARSHVKAILQALDDKNKEAVSEHLSAYQALLTEHIKKEDEILYPWMDRNLSAAQIDELISRFAEKDGELSEKARDAEQFVNLLEDKYNQINLT